MCIRDSVERDRAAIRKMDQELAICLFEALDRNSGLDLHTLGKKRMTNSIAYLGIFAQHEPLSLIHI